MRLPLSAPRGDRLPWTIGLVAMMAVASPIAAEEISVVREVAKCVLQCPQDKMACENYCQCVVSFAHKNYTLEEFRQIEAAVVTDQPISDHLLGPVQALTARAADCAAVNLNAR